MASQTVDVIWANNGQIICGWTFDDTNGQVQSVHYQNLSSVRARVTIRRNQTTNSFIIDPGTPRTVQPVPGNRFVLVFVDTPDPAESGWQQPNGFSFSLDVGV